MKIIPKTENAIKIKKPLLAQLIVSRYIQLYERYIQSPYKSDKVDYILINKLLKEYGVENVIKKSTILAHMCNKKSAWFVKQGFLAFSPKTLSRHWNEIVAKKSFDDQLKERLLERGVKC